MIIFRCLVCKSCLTKEEVAHEGGFFCSQPRCLALRRALATSIAGRT